MSYSTASSCGKWDTSPSTSVSSGSVRRRPGASGSRRDGRFRNQERVTRMKFVKVLGVLGALLLGTACASSQAYRDAVEEESRSHWDMAVVKYGQALEGDPKNSQYRIALENAKRRASQVHFERGKIYRNSGQPELAVVELEQTRALDPTNHYAETELAKARSDAEKAAAERDGESRMQSAKRRTRGARARAPMLEPASDRPINLNFPQPKPIKQIYQ